MCVDEQASRSVISYLSSRGKWSKIMERLSTWRLFDKSSRPARGNRHAKSFTGYLDEVTSTSAEKAPFIDRCFAYLNRRPPNVKWCSRKASKGLGSIRRDTEEHEETIAFEYLFCFSLSSDKKKNREKLGKEYKVWENVIPTILNLRFFFLHAAECGICFAKNNSRSLSLSLIISDAIITFEATHEDCLFQRAVNISVPSLGSKDSESATDWSTSTLLTTTGK